MAKRRPDETLETGQSQPQDIPPANETPPSGAAQEADASNKSKWVTRFGIFGDYEAGVRLIEDRQNRRMTVQFQEKPSEAVRAVLKGKENGYRFDSEDQLWYKPINQAKPRQSREEADELVLTVADMIRAEKGLPPKKEATVAI